MMAAVTINFRKPELTTACVESLLADGWAPILVWDNSDDGGASMRSLTAQLGDDSRVHLVPSLRNLGFAAGMNAALAALGGFGYRGPVLLINNDARVRSGLRVAMQAALAVPTPPTLVAPRIEQGGREQGWLYYQPWFALLTKRPVWGSFHYLSGCCLLVSRHDNAQPLFDEDFFMYGEDVELSHRIERHGGQLVLLDAVYVTHLGSASSGEASMFYETQVVRGHCLLAGKLGYDRGFRAMMYVLRGPVLAVRAFIRGLRYKTVTPIKALWFAARSRSA